MPTITADTAAGVLSAAADLARRYQITPGWEYRLTREARALVQAVNAHAEATR